MMHEKYIHRFLIFVIVCATIGLGQFIEVNVDLDMRRLSEGNRQFVHSLEDDIKQYYLNTQFSPGVNDLEINIDFHLVMESVSQGGSQPTINAQAIITNQSDQYYYAKGIQFPYSKGKKIIYTPSFDPFASFLDYYAFMLIATELDTWEYMGGVSFFNRAIAHADLGKDSDWSRGWEDRWKKARNIKNNQYLRSMRFNYFLAQDELRSDKIDANRVLLAMTTFYEDLKSIDKKLGSNKETLKFLNVYHLEIAKLLAVLKLRNSLELLKVYDHDNKKVYESYLIN